MMDRMRVQVLPPRLSQLSKLSCIALAVLLAGCLYPKVRLEPVDRSFAPAPVQAVTVYGSAQQVQRDFALVALIHVEGDPTLAFDRDAIMDMTRLAARAGANGLVLEDLRAARPEAVDGDLQDGAIATERVASAIRVFDRRWADRYWRFGASPGPLAQRASLPQPQNDWRRVSTWNGTGGRQTEQFTIAEGEWRIVWEAATDPADGNLEVLIYQLPGDHLAARIDQDGGGAGVYLGLPGGGTYYLKIQGEGLSWQVAVETLASVQR